MLCAIPFWSFGLAFLVPETALQSFLVDAGAGTRIVGGFRAIGLLSMMAPALLSPFLFRFMRRTRLLVSLGWMTAVLSYAVAGLLLLVMRPDKGMAMWLPVLCAYAFHMCLAGMLSPLGVSCTGRSLLPARRGVVLGGVNAVGALAGFAGGYVAARWLNNADVGRYAAGFIFGGLCAGVWGLIWMNVRESSKNERTEIAGIKDYMRDLRAIVTREHNFRYYLAVMVIIYMTMAPTAFVTEHARRNLAGASSLGGYLTMARYFGLFFGALAAGWIADRLGARFLPAIYVASTLVWFGLLLFATRPEHVVPLMAMRGAALGFLVVAQTKLIFDLCPRKNMASHGALLYCAIGLCGAAAVWAAARWIEWLGHPALFRAGWCIILMTLAVTVRFAWVIGRDGAGATAPPARPE